MAHRAPGVRLGQAEPQFHPAPLGTVAGAGEVKAGASSSLLTPRQEKSSGVSCFFAGINYNQYLENSLCHNCLPGLCDPNITGIKAEYFFIQKKSLQSGVGLQWMLTNTETKYEKRLVPIFFFLIGIPYVLCGELGCAATFVT